MTSSKRSSILEFQIDDVELHGLGSSINCLGRRVASYTTRDAKEIAKLLAMVSFLCFIAHKFMGL